MVHTTKIVLGMFLLTVAICSHSQTINNLPNTIDPKTKTFTPIQPENSATHYQKSNPTTPIQYQNQNSNGMHSSDIQRRSRQNSMNRMGYKPPGISPSDPVLAHEYIKQQQIAYIRKLLKEDLPEIQNAKEQQHLEQTKNFRSAYAKLMQMQKGERPFSLKHAIFIIEDAYLGHAFSYEGYCELIQNKTDLIKGLMQRKGISQNDDLGKNFLIQKLFSERIVEVNETGNKFIHEPYRYDFEDFWGDRDWSKMFVTKLLLSGKGQCHSMPLLYLILAEELNTEAWLSLAPEHSFIVFKDGNALYNYETTSGHLVSNDWLMESGYVTASAIQNGVYLDTLNRNELIGTLISDLIMGYTNRFGYDTFVMEMVDQLLKIHPKSIQGNIFRADLLVLMCKQQIQKAGNPSPDEIHNYPRANKMYQFLLRQYDRIDALGYVRMPKEKYKAWLASLENSKHQQENQKFKTRVIEHVTTKN